jgi:hypothetical protein
VIATLAFVAGALIMFAFCRVRRANDRITWILRGQAQAELSHGWHQPVDGSPVATPRRRSPDEQFVTHTRSQAPPRPVLDDQR